MKNKRMLVATVCSLLLSTAVQANSMDPVSDSEVSRAKSLAQVAASAPAVSTFSARSARVAVQSEDTAATPMVEFLRVEAHRFDKNDPNIGQRWADVTSYDYATDELIIAVVNLDTDKVISTKRHKDMQPPMSQAELTRALNIVMEDPEERSILNAEYKRITGDSLNSIDQLNYKAFTFFADSMPNVVNSASSSCGAQRCAQLMLYTHDNIVFEVSPIVNLSAGVVTQRMGY